MDSPGPSDQVPMNDSEDWVSVHRVTSSEHVTDVDNEAAPASEEVSSSEANESEEGSPSTHVNDLETTQSCAPANVAFSDCSSEHSSDNPPEAPTPEPVAASVGAGTSSDEVSQHVAIPDAEEHINEAPPPAVAREWSQAECHMNDIRYAEKKTPCIPHRVQKQQLKILVTGQPETGRTTAIKNLFASIAEDPEWSPTDVSGLTIEDFRSNPGQFTSTVTDRKDTGGHLSISYVIQETPGIKGDPAVAAETLANYMRTEQEAYAAQEAKLDVPRGQLSDERVDCVLYFLPTNARIGESDLDFIVINALAAYAPVIPLMCKADCLEQEEILQRKSELERLRQDGLKVYSFPEDVVSKLNDSIHADFPLSRSEPPIDEPVVAPSSGPAFRPPFNIVAGTHANLSVSPYWFVRKYRWAECEAYRTSNSDLRLLRQLLLEDGFWCVKDEADACYRNQRMIPAVPGDVAAAAAAAAPVEEAPEVTPVLHLGNETVVGSSRPESSSGKSDETVTCTVTTEGEVPPGELRQSGRGSRFVPAWLGAREPPAPKSTQTPPIYPLVPGSPSLREVVSTRGIGASARPASRTTTPPPNKPTTVPPQRPSLDGVSQNLLSISSEHTEFDTMTGAAAGAHALAMLTADVQGPPAEASTSSQLGSISNPLASSSTSPPPAAAPVAPLPTVEHKLVLEEPAFDENTCMEATVKEITRGTSRNYRLTLQIGVKQLCLRIGDTEGSSISAAWRHTATSRPSAYDATSELLKALKCSVERILITECTNTIFHARVFAVNKCSGHHIDVDARPSDAINLALRHKAPIFVNNDVVRDCAK